jgi:ketosteroid isomerase-like protein
MPVSQWVRIGSEAGYPLAERDGSCGGDTVAVIGPPGVARRRRERHDTDFVHVVTFVEGRIIRFQEFFDTYAAGEAFRPG